MDESLFRKEAMSSRSRSLYGDVVIRTSLPSWIITALLILIFIGAAAVLLFGRVETADGSMALWRWLWALSR